MKFKIKSYTGTVHTECPVIKLNKFLRLVPKYEVVHIRLIVNPGEYFSETENLIISLVEYLDLRSLSKFVVSSINPNYDENGEYLTIFVYDPYYDLPF